MFLDPLIFIKSEALKSLDKIGILSKQPFLGLFQCLPCFALLFILIRTMQKERD